MSILGSLGSLVLSLSTDSTQFTAGLSQAEQISRTVSKNIERNLASASDAVAAKLQGIAAAALSVGSVVAVLGVTKEIVKATAAFDDMAERTGIAVEELSKMSQVAKVGSHDLGGIEAAAGRLVKGLSATDDETKGVGKAIEALGIKAKDAQGNIRPLGDLLPQISTELNKYADSSSKTAVAQDLFGKSGMKVLPFLKDYAEMGSIAAKVTAEQAAQAETLEKTWNKLALEQENMRRAVVLALTPAMQLMASTLLDNKLNADSLTQTITRFAQDGSLEQWAEKAALAMATLLDRIKTVGSAIVTVGVAFSAAVNDVDLVNKIGAFTSLPTPDNFGEMMKAFSARQKSAQDFSREWEALLNRDTDATRRALAEQLRLQKEYAGLASAFGIGMEGPKPQLNYRPDQSTDLKRMLDEQRKAAEELQKVLDRIYGKDVFDSTFFSSLETLAAGFVDGSLSVGKYVDAIYQMVNQQPFMKHYAEGQVKAFDEEFERIERNRLAIEARIKAAREVAEGLEFEVAAMRMTNSEREIAINLRNLETQGVKVGTEAYEAFAQRIRAAVEAKEGLKDQIDLWKSIESTAHDVWTSIGKDGTNVFKQLGQTLKSAVLDLLYQLTVKSWIINIGANFAGMSPQAFAAQMGTSYLGGGSGGLGGLAAGALGAGEFYNGLSTGAMVYAPGTAGFYGAEAAANLGGMGFGSTLAGAGIAGLAGGAVGYFGSAALGAGARGQQVGGLSGAGLAVIGGAIAGPIGAAIGAVLGALIGKFTDPDGLANRSARFGQLGANATGVAYSATSSFGRFGFSDTHWFSDDEMQATMQGFLTLQTQIDNAVFALANPDQRASITTRLNASSQDYSFGTEHGDFTSQLAGVARDRLETEIGVLYPGIAAFVHNFQGSLEELYSYVQNFLNFRSIIADIEQGGGPLETASEAFRRSQNQWTTALEDSNSAIQSQIDGYDDSAAATQRLVTATASWYTTQVQLLVQIESIRHAVGEMFGNTARTIQLSGLDEQGKYNFYQQEAEQLYSQLMASNDPQAIQRYAERINEDIMAAFNLLSPEEQQAQSGDFLERLNRLNDAVDGRLQDVESEVTDRVTNILNQVQTALDAAAAAQQTAANTNVDAANTQLAAAGTPHQVHVTLELPNGQVTTFEGGG